MVVRTRDAPRERARSDAGERGCASGDGSGDVAGETTERARGVVDDPFESDVDDCVRGSDGWTGGKWYWPVMARRPGTPR